MSENSWFLFGGFRQQGIKTLEVHNGVTRLMETKISGQGLGFRVKGLGFRGGERI